MDFSAPGMKMVDIRLRAKRPTSSTLMGCGNEFEVMDLQQNGRPLSPDYQVNLPTTHHTFEKRHIPCGGIA